MLRNDQKKKSSKLARATASKVVTYCEDCDEQLTMYITCFTRIHEKFGQTKLRVVFVLLSAIISRFINLDPYVFIVV